MNNDKFTTILSADYMYLIFLGNTNIIDKIIKRLNKKSDVQDGKMYKIQKGPYKSFAPKKIKNIYIKCPLHDPCVGILENDNIQTLISDDKSMNKCIILDEGIESAQCLTYADISSNDTIIRNSNISSLMMLMKLVEDNSYIRLTFPILQLDKEENPDKMIGNWLKENNLDDVIKELLIRPVNIVGNEHEILVFSAFIIP